MDKMFEYKVCQIIGSKVTQVNGKWQSEHADASDCSLDMVLESCPHVWKYINKMGQDGWELISAVSTYAGNSESYQTIYLKREIIAKTPSGMFNII
jgi:hypothetical protein